MPRLFTGIELPEDLRDDLADMEQPLPGARWIDTDDMHITLRFVGDIDNRTASEFADMLAGIDVNAFHARISGLGTFGGKEPRSIWAGIEAGPELEQLARAHERAARSAGLPPEGRQFKPHVTIARLKSTRPEVVARYLEHFGGYRSEPFLVTHFTLFSSKPKVGGGPYVVEETFPLFGGGNAQGLMAYGPG
ncbi:putative 2'-5' RNA ligase [Candidatus Filomicrobium marinum]|uniref:RNA 2',3'-cyclic phosphodiesterase n=2 Tax=Filomicrobium TaxID=119044 RepID=A0A0D6JCE0_9HYPH|nr:MULTISPECIES: RNA 2',3'-cyclic phosphodiesterase [Filomicrobium]MCV0368472.1 RNA 2',3'-cyclic phosphodiesterase [Filomicrobium sp.]CFX10028.1 putative 2'-5' RNA ligase [Candidatus Filomicrobium marinum]CPR17052.1 putative 2'-5' RNA ligase [Candidatus Filomicrobium marinum]SDO40386.1 2'-5' RNA ligase [Filomicrobium insigne]